MLHTARAGPGGLVPWGPSGAAGPILPSGVGAHSPAHRCGRASQRLLEKGQGLFCEHLQELKRGEAGDRVGIPEGCV